MTRSWTKVVSMATEVREGTERQGGHDGEFYSGC